MRNIEQTVCSILELFAAETETDVAKRLPEKLHASSTGCIDPATGRCFIVNQYGYLVCTSPCGNGQYVICARLELQRQQSGYSTGSYDFGHLINLAWLEEESTLFAVFRTGELVGFAISPGFTANEHVFNIHTIVGGIAGASWSPDCEQLVLVTNTQDNDDEAKLLLIARGLTFNVLSESTLDTSNPGEKQFITVGWGKKETQFHGKAGKEARKDVMPTADVAINDVPAEADAFPVISWREDCNYFAVSSLSRLENLHSGQHVIRVYDRDGVLQYTSEHVPPHIGSALAWRPSGNLIAATYAAATGKDVNEAGSPSGLPPVTPWQIIFFEKNGLRHGEFSLGEPYLPSNCAVTTLLWNADSSLLAVVVEFPVIDESDSKTFILLWTVMNYHWYLKQTLPLKPGSRLTQIMFDPINALQLHVIVDGTRFYTLNFRRNVCCTAEELLSHVAVIDGNRILVTCFGEEAGAAVIPPPMCSYAVTFPRSISEADEHVRSPLSVNACCFYRISKQLFFVATTSDYKRHVFVCPPFGERTEELISSSDQQSTLSAAIQVSREQAPPQLPLMRYVCSFDNSVSARPLPNLIDDLRLIESLSNFCYKQNPFTLTNNQDEREVHKDLSVVGCELSNSGDAAPNIILHFVGVSKGDEKDHGIGISDASRSSATIFRQLTLLPWSSDGDSQQHKEDDIFELAGRSVDSFKLLHRSTTAAGLDFIIISHNGAINRLYADTEQIADDCTSYCIHPNFLVYTTHRDELKCVPRTALERVTASRGRRTQNADLELLRAATFSRACEKGAFIVSCSATQVVLQMPRGNLEAIYPRALVVQRIFSLLSSQPTPCYAEAYQLARRHRVNTNLLYDFDADRFRKNIDEFIQQLLQAIPSSSSARKQMQNDYLELFITDFDAQDSTQGEYKDLFDGLVGSEQRNSLLVVEENAGKDFQLLLNLLKQHLHARLAASSTGDDERRLLFRSILATYAKLCQFEDAIMCCKQWRSAYSAYVFSLDEALKFLMYWVHDMNKLFDYALSTYDFEIALLVGQKSTRDPREFVPLLRQFRSLSPLSFQYYSIDRHLQNYRKALKNLVDCVFELQASPPVNVVNEENASKPTSTTPITLQEALKTLVQLVSEQKLYTLAISLLSEQKSVVEKTPTISETLTTIRCNYADYLYNVFQNYNEAACQYYHAGVYDRACQLYQTCANWQMALVCKASVANSGGGDAESGSLIDLARKAVRQLTLARRFDEAHNVAVTWVNDYELAFQTCVDGHLWRDARALLYHPRAMERQPKTLALEVAVKQQANVMRDDIGQWLQKLNEYFDRLMFVRKRRAARASSGGVDFGDEAAAAGDDTVSTITSTTSTASSRMSSVSRHKSREDRKKRSLKSGGRYEHLALMEALRGEVYTPALALSDAVINVLEALVLCDDTDVETDKAAEIGKLLQNDYNDLVQSLASRSSAIWRPEEQLSEVYQLSSCIQPQQQLAVDGNLTLINAVLGTPGRIDKAKSEALYVDGMTAEDVTLFVPPKIDLTKWKNSMLMGFKHQ